MRPDSADVLVAGSAPVVVVSVGAARLATEPGRRATPSTRLVAMAVAVAMALGR